MGSPGSPQRDMNTLVKIIAPDSDYWPLPWYLRRFKHVGWYKSFRTIRLHP